MNKDWKKAQKWEKEWHGNCVNSYGEEEKQLLYARRMGLKFFHNGKSPYNINMKGKTVLDIGGGAYSLLLKCVKLEQGYVVDPLIDVLPSWVKDRYRSAKILSSARRGEDLEHHPLTDEVWIYNVLQHTEDPCKVIQNARKIGKIVRLFEWIDTGVNEGHLHNLNEEILDKWLGGVGKVETLNGEANCFGRCYYGVFNGKTS